MFRGPSLWCFKCDLASHMPFFILIFWHLCDSLLDLDFKPLAFKQIGYCPNSECKQYPRTLDRRKGLAGWVGGWVSWGVVVDGRQIEGWSGRGWRWRGGDIVIDGELRCRWLDDSSIYCQEAALMSVSQHLWSAWGGLVGGGWGWLGGWVVGR